MQTSEEEMIIEALKHCFEISDEPCPQCPMNSLCMRIDADRLGELFLKAAGFVTPERKESGNDI